MSSQPPHLPIATTASRGAAVVDGRPASASEIEAYYEAEKATQFTTPASRDVRVIVNKDKAKVEAAKKALEGDQSVANWKKVAPKYSSDPTTKTNGGLQKGITEEFVTGELIRRTTFTATEQELKQRVEALRSAGVVVAASPAALGTTMRDVLKG